MNHLSRSTDPWTSFEAAESIEPIAGRQRREVYWTLAKYPDGLTDDALARLLPEYVPSGVRTRRVELQRMGRVVEAGVGRTRSGRKALLWRVDATKQGELFA